MNLTACELYLNREAIFRTKKDQVGAGALTGSGVGRGGECP